MKLLITMNSYRLLCLLCLCSAAVAAQSTVFPGDADANGLVDQYDVPYIGYAVGATGAARIVSEDDAALPQPIALPWAESFPSGLNLIHADVDGNGVVDVFDFFPWTENFGLSQEDVTPVPLSPLMPDAPAVFRWNNGELAAPLTGGATFELPLDLLLDDAYAVNGLAFRLRYNPTHFAAVFFSTTDNWLKADGGGISLQNTTPGVFNVGMTRLGNDPVAGGGTCGTLSLIIIDDMIDLLETAPDTLTTRFVLEGVQLLDGELEALPVSADSFELKLYRPGTVSNTGAAPDALRARLYPNPARGPFTITAATPFDRLQITDALGRTVYQNRHTPRRQWTAPALGLPSGVYHVRVEGARGRSFLRLMIPDDE